MAPQPIVSFEIFPPKTPEGERSLERARALFETVRPVFLSVTYGADGSGQERSIDLIDRLTGCETPVAAHLTCVGHGRDDVDSLALKWRDMGIRRVVALRGDVPGGGKWQPREDGYSCAADLVAGLSKVADFDIAVACYPECHPDSPSPEADLENLKAKQDAGASLAITQYCFETDTILRFRDKARAAGITIPISAGIMPIMNFDSIARFSAKCGAGMPSWLADRFKGVKEDARAAAEVAVAVAAAQCRVLLEEGFDSLHFYTLNRAELSLAVCAALGGTRKRAEAA